MPIYEYECCQCGHVQEVLQKFSDEPLRTCSHCSGDLQRLISHSSFHLKGSGWYVTDYTKKSKSASSPTDSNKQTPPTSKKESKATADDSKE
jgi:putative FmdB family regulatory protein